MNCKTCRRKSNTENPCPVCLMKQRQRQQIIKCNECGIECHRKCTGMVQDTFRRLKREGRLQTLVCDSCSPNGVNTFHVHRWMWNDSTPNTAEVTSAAMSRQDAGNYNIVGIDQEYIQHSVEAEAQFLTEGTSAAMSRQDAGNYNIVGIDQEYIQHSVEEEAQFLSTSEKAEKFQLAPPKLRKSRRTRRSEFKKLRRENALMERARIEIFDIEIEEFGEKEFLIDGSWIEIIEEEIKFEAEGTSTAMSRQDAGNNNIGNDIPPPDKEDIQQAVKADAQFLSKYNIIQSKKNWCDHTNIHHVLRIYSRGGKLFMLSESQAVTAVNMAIKTRDCDLLMKTLQHPRSQLPQVHEFAGSMYMEEFCRMREEKENEEHLDYDEIYAIVGELTSEMENVINNALSRGNPDQVLVDKFRLRITKKDIATLSGLNWLNDKVINFFMNMLMERGEKDGNSKVYAFNTFFYDKVKNGGHAAVKNWTRQVDVLAVDYILVPVHLRTHWCLAVIDFKQKDIQYYDSMGRDNQKCLNVLKQYLCGESADKKKTEFNTNGWKCSNIKGIPQQTNGSDCGMFACKYAEYITREAQITFTQADMPYFRRRMVYEIIQAQLLH